MREEKKEASHNGRLVEEEEKKEKAKGDTIKSKENRQVVMDHSIRPTHVGMSSTVSIPIDLGSNRWMNY
jgi:hypothetical protein